MASAGSTKQTQPQPTRHFRLQLSLDDLTGTSGGQPAKGGMKTEGLAADRFDFATSSGGDLPSASREVYVLVRGDGEAPETPLLKLDETGGNEALVIFSGREAAISFLQTTRWNEYELKDLSALALEALAERLRREKISQIVVNPAYPSHQDQRPGPVINLDRLADRTGESLLREIKTLGA